MQFLNPEYFLEKTNLGFLMVMEKVYPGISLLPPLPDWVASNVPGFYNVAAPLGTPNWEQQCVRPGQRYTMIYY